jgi:hypothetical protein
LKQAKITFVPVTLPVALLAFQALVLHLMGHPSVSTTHSLMLWAGEVHSRENSQQLTDWYTFSHIIHGFLFYFGLWLLFPRLPVWQRFILAVACESAWEILENTPVVIRHYRQQALAQGYVGDSIINSLSDSLRDDARLLFRIAHPGMGDRRGGARPRSIHDVFGT